jgi:uncharacterized protein (TIGR03790 family)
LQKLLEESASEQFGRKRALFVCTPALFLTPCRRDVRSGLRVALRAACTLALSLFAVAAAHAQSGENVAVVINDASPASRTIGEHYIAKRGVPASNVIHINTTQDEEVDRRTYTTAVELPVRAHIVQQRQHDRILYIVLTKGVPLRISGSGGPYGTYASVDAELMLLYRRMTGDAVSPLGAVDNPYFLNTNEVSEARPFTHREHDLYLVTRLDGYTVEDVLALIDRATAPAVAGDILLTTEKPPRSQSVNDWLTAAAARLAKQQYGPRVFIEDAAVAGEERAVFGFFASSSRTPSGPPQRMHFVPGSLAARFADADARTFKEAAKVADAIVPRRDLLLADLVRAGITGAAGFIGDPNGGSIVRPDILFPAYVAGFNLAEAFYMAMPHLSRRTVVIGDPLCAPYRRKTLSDSELESAHDPVMEMSADFARRRLASLRREYPHVPAGAFMLSIRANSLYQSGELEAARHLLEAATAFAPDFASGHAQLAVMYDQVQNYDMAIERYRRALDVQPAYVRSEVVEISNAGVMEVRLLALNNLAFDLAVHRHAPEEALPFARKALTFAPQDPDLLDTLGWIEHLVGDDNNAIVHLRAAVARTPANADVWLHAAIVAAAFDLRVEAEKYLTTAIQLNGALETSAEVAAVRARFNAAVH